MKKNITGKFSVQSQPLPVSEAEESIGAMRMKFEKKFMGALEGRNGSFCLQHSCVMDGGKQSQSITVIPGTGTDELRGLAGSMKIDIVDGQHFYSLEYEISASTPSPNH